MRGGILKGTDYNYNFADEVGMPKVENGYWFFNDRHKEVSENLLERHSFNSTLAIPDTDSNVLYVYVLDT
ncbi:MAG TPA: hypothetical protein VFD33_00085 [Bacillota bacterium]|nr:hypothetical protein [Bacillota bacterium]